MLDTRQPSVDEDMRSLQLIYRVSLTELTVRSSPPMRTSERQYWEILACLLDSIHPPRDQALSGREKRLQANF
jgi:hypothetical protein